jgi:hypothetical protein
MPDQVEENRRRMRDLLAKVQRGSALFKMPQFRKVSNCSFLGVKKVENMKRFVISAIVAVLSLSTAPARADWSLPVRISEPGGCMYPQILAQGDTLHVVYTNLYPHGKISYVRSTDAGNSWSGRKVLSDSGSSYLALSPRVMRNGQRLMCIWLNRFNAGVYLYNVGCNISNDDGRTWGSPRYILNPSWQYSFYPTASASGSSVNIIISYGYAIVDSVIFYNIRSTNFGATWGQPVEMFRVYAAGVGDMVSIGNLVHYAWGCIPNSGDDIDVYYIRSTDAGITWSPMVRLTDADNKPSQRPSLAVYAGSAVAFSWWDAKYCPYGTLGDIFAKQSFDAGRNWGLEDEVTFGHMATLSDLAWVGDSLYLVWQDHRFANLTVFYVSSPDSIHDWSPEQRLEDDPAHSSFPAVTASNGRVYVVWADERCAPDTDICGGVYFTRKPAFPDAINEPGVIPHEAATLSAYPNPFNTSITITYSNMRGGDIRIYDVKGQLVRTFSVEGEKDGKIIWDAHDASGKKVSSGIYFARARASQKTQVIKLVYLR